MSMTINIPMKMFPMSGEGEAAATETMRANEAYTVMLEMKRNFRKYTKPGRRPTMK